MLRTRCSNAACIWAATLAFTMGNVSAGDMIQASHEADKEEQAIQLVSCSDDCVEESCIDDACVPDDCVDGCCEEVFAKRENSWLPELEPITFETCDWKGSAGGALRYRYLHEIDRLRPPGPGLSSYSQWRLNMKGSLTYKDTITFYADAIDASTFGEELPILPIDDNRHDFLEFYVDAKVAELKEGDLHFRYGRQTLLYGDQHVLSPLAWANTFRNFHGFKAYYKGDKWDIDAFAVQPVNDAARGTFPPTQTNSFDTPDQSEWVSGVYSTYRGLDQGTLDLYWIWDVENEPAGNRQDGDRHTFGARYYGAKQIKDCCDNVERTWNYDVQGGFQVGSDRFTGGMAQGPSLNVSSYFLNGFLAHSWDQVDMKPQIFALYWLGTGDNNPLDSNNNTYFSLYPLGHAYWGILDNFSGQNLVDYSVGGKISPIKKLTLLSQYHWFDKHRSQDFIYNIAGAPLGPNGAAAPQDSHIGSELDLVATYKVNKNLTLQSGYSWIWYGNAVQQTALNRGDATQFYFLANYAF